MEKHYFIKPGYRINPEPVLYLNTEEDEVTYQIDVYRHVAGIVQARSLMKVMDLGCGYALKLRDFVAPLCGDIVGVDTARAIDFCRKQHRFGRWHVDDLESPTLALGERFDLILSADVIEHLVDPDPLLDCIRRHAHPGTTVILSTPERDRRRGPDSMGPPQNAAHVREWNQAEFAAYLENRGFEILEHRIMDMKAGMPTCQTVSCRVRPSTSEGTASPG